MASRQSFVPTSGRWVPAGAALIPRGLLELAQAGYRVVEPARARCAPFHRPFTHVVATDDGRTFLTILRK